MTTRRMYTTSATLLEQLRHPSQPDAWERFVSLYTPLIFYWALRKGLQGHDAADLVQDVFLVLVRRLPSFYYFYCAILCLAGRPRARGAGRGRRGGNFPVA